MSSHHTHSHDKPHPTADDGTLLEVKEGIVLDASGQPLTNGNEQGKTTKSSTFVWRAGWLALPIVIGVALPFLLMTGFAVLGIFFLILSIFWIAKTILPKSYGKFS